MNRIKGIFLFLIAVLFFSSSLILAEEGQKKDVKSLLNVPSDQDKPKKDEEKFGSEIPDWLKRTNYGISVETHQKPRYYLETVQPLYQTMDKTHTFFTHDRISIQNERGTYSAGLGYRRLLFNDGLLAGINTFFDYQDLHRHYRQGLGIEAIGKRLEARLNSYFGLSPKRIVQETSASTTYEKAVDGYDIELGGPVPYLPWLKLFGSYYYYDYKKFKDMGGGKFRAEIKPFEFIVINLETYNDNKGGAESSIDCRLNLAVDDFTPRSILSAFKLAKEPYPATDLTKRTLDRVERNFVIQVEKWKETGNGIIEIKRGN